MQDMYRHLPEELSLWYDDNARGQTDVHVQICISFQKSMFCVTNAAIAGTMPNPWTQRTRSSRKPTAPMPRPGLDG